MNGLKVKVPAVLILEGEGVERTIRLEICNTQNEMMDYLSLCVALKVAVPEIQEDSEKPKRKPQKMVVCD